VSEFKAARDAANSAYAVRVCGMTPNTDCHKYFGDFDYMAVVNEAAVPEPDEHKHAYFWGQFWELFDKRWREHHSAV
jgi:hypothetical protein